MYTYITSGMTFADWLIVTRYFSVASSISIAWVAAGVCVFVCVFVCVCVCACVCDTSVTAAGKYGSVLDLIVLLVQKYKY
jgi:hypothetical protein